jgi:hypothetical protein
VVSEGCGRPDLAVNSQPDATFTDYLLYQAPVTVFSYNLNSIVTATPETTCSEEPVVEFINADGTAIDSELFSIVTVDAAAKDYQFVVQTDSLEHIGLHRMQFKFYFEKEPSNFVYSDVFTVEVFNPCVPGTHGSAQTVVMPAMDYTIDPSEPSSQTTALGVSVEPVADCIAQVEFSWPTDFAIADALEFNGDSITANPSDVMALMQNVASIDEPFTYFAEIGGETVESAESTMHLVNPCFTDKVTVQAVPLGPQELHAYEVLEFDFQPFDFMYENDLMMTLCGEFVYTVENGILDSVTTTEDMTVIIDPTAHEDITQMLNGAPYTYTVTGFYKDHESSPTATASVSETIYLYNPCVEEPDGRSIEITSSVTELTVDYDEDAHMHISAVAVPDAVCTDQITYSCTYLNGPY